MSVLVLRSCARYAARKEVRLRTQDGLRVDALLTELSLEGCRLTQLGQALLPADETISLRVDRSRELKARLRWQRDGAAGLRFANALHYKELEALIAACRPPLPTSQAPCAA